MEKITKVLGAGLLSASLLIPQFLFAHAALTLASPADGDVLNAAPEMLMLEFNEDVQLLKLRITRADSDEIDTGFSPAAQAARHFSVPLPELEEGRYTANWTALGKDSHQIEDSFSFLVDADATPVSNTATGEAATPGAQHDHGH